MSTESTNASGLPSEDWLLDELPDLTVVVELSSLAIADVGAFGLQGYGYEPDDWRGHELAEFVELDPGALHPTTDLAHGRQPGVDRREASVLSADGTSEICLVTSRVIDEHHAVCSAQRLVDVRRSQSRMSDLMHLARLTRDIFVVTDEAGIITYVNDATRHFHGDQKFVGRPVADFAEPTSWNALVERILAGETSVETRILGLAKDGSLTPLSMRTEYDPETRRWYTIERDISDLVAREDQEKRLVSDLREQAMTDPLTGLANRSAFRLAVEEAIANNATFGILMLDMDDFKSVNDTLGHSVGDEFLIEVSARIRNAVPSDDVVARLGGDEFVVLGFGLNSKRLSPVAERILDRVSAPFSLGEHSLQRSCSIGGAVFEPEDTFTDIMLRADQAAYSAKHAGRSRFRIAPNS